MKYYAEHNTDKIIRQKYFPDYNYKGLIVEVGGGTPEFLSMSKHFKDTGWRTIIFEPNPKFAQLHRDMGNEVFEIACSNEDKSGEFTIVEQHINAYGGVVTDHSFSSINIKENYLNYTGFRVNESNSKKNKRRYKTVRYSIKISQYR